MSDALAAIEHGLDLLATVVLDGEDDRAVLHATVTVQRQANWLAALHLGLVGRADETGAYVDDGAATLAAWLRPRTLLDAGECSRRVTAGARLWRFPALAAAAREGEISAAHVMAVTSAAVPRRAATIAAHDEVLTLLARHAPPRDVKVALTRIAEHADADGVDRPSETFDPALPDPRCELWLRPGIDGLGDLQATLSQLDTEGLLTLLDALETPDPPDTPEDLRRSAAQRRGDAFSKLIRRALAHGLAPSVRGVKPQVLLALDLAALLPAAERGALDLADLFATAGISDNLLQAAGGEPTTLHPVLDTSERDTVGDGGDWVGGTGTATGNRASKGTHGAEAPPPRSPRRPRARLRFTGDVGTAAARQVRPTATVRHGPIVSRRTRPAHPGATRRPPRRGVRAPRPRGPHVGPSPR